MPVAFFFVLIVIGIVFGCIISTRHAGWGAGVNGGARPQDGCDVQAAGGWKPSSLSWRSVGSVQCTCWPSHRCAIIIFHKLILSCFPFDGFIYYYCFSIFVKRVLVFNFSFIPMILFLELDDGVCNPLWTMKGFTQTFHYLKESRRAQSVPLNALLTYVTVPWYSIIAGKGVIN
jgi:hypothetical protein